MKRNLIIGAGVVVSLLALYFLFGNNAALEASDIYAEVKKGKFKVEIETTGELEAKNSVKILGPSSLMNFDIYQVTIQSIVNEGTVVKKGDWIATLDRSEFQKKFSAKQIELEKAKSKFNQTQLDTTLQMRLSRDELINLKYGVEEKAIILEQSKFEPPAYIKQADINLDKAKRGYDQALDNYKIKKNQHIEKMREVSAELRKVQNEMDGMTTVLKSFDVLAPEDGMVIYEKGWDGKPIKAGSQIQMWEPNVASLPDLTKMKSKTYVNEVDVRKVKAGQEVNVGLDAYPEKKLAGVVTSVANVGEQRPNSDSKVFEVSVEIKGTDATLRPSMTTSNRILTHAVDSVLYIPLESLHSLHDSITFVFLKDGLDIIKQEVIVAESNTNDVIVTKGVKENDKLYLSIPASAQTQDVKLLPELNGKRNKKETKKEENPPTTAEAKIPTKS